MLFRQSANHYPAIAHGKNYIHILVIHIRTTCINPEQNFYGR